ncbi:MAG: ATP-binding cassette domain-containing protein [Gammaproteobacteria bacterium]|nr:ATP-binding cassette domain-containing protein [Gammaproteobacteria bacterium]MDE0225373.1 ATP-binding cassette domain-containing protein [Gammaproteobacteria bacterium]
MAATETPLIELVDVGRVYRRAGAGRRGVATRALSDVTLRIDPGEFVAVMGPSGSGKSTLMNILGCLDRPTQGVYRFQGRDVGQLSADERAALRRESFGFVFQSYNLLGSATARENVEMPAAYAHLGRALRAERAEGLLRAFALGNRLGHRPRALSGGEQQRVAIARALMNGGRVILADEPTGALDSKNGEDVLAVLADLSARGHTVIVITHDPEVAAWSERRIELLDGRVVADRRTEGVTRPARGDTVVGPNPSPRSEPSGRRTGIDFQRAAESLRGTLASLRANLLRGSRLRTALTVLSVTVGVWSVVAMLSVVQGGYRESVETVSRIGADRIFVRSGVAYGDRKSTPVRLTLADAEAIRREVDNVRAVLPHVSGQLTLRQGDRSVETTVQAAVPEMLVTDRLRLARGVFFSERDSADHEPVVVIGAGISDELFPVSAAVGRHVLVGGAPFVVKGVLARYRRSGSVVEDYRDKQVLVPLGTAQALLFGRESLDSITVSAEDPKRVGETARAVDNLLARRHGHRGFSLSSDIPSMIGFSTVERLMSALMGAVGAISLFVGGMGVTSVMLVSVAERTREIGIRMATGARRQDILRQFLLEAVAVTVAGGVLGTMLGFASRVVFDAFEVPAALSVWFVFAALACAVGTGLAAGIVPARRAAALDPVAALSR